MSKFERFIRSATPERKRRFIAARRKFAAFWAKRASKCERRAVQRAKRAAKNLGISFGEYVLRQVEWGQPVPIC